MKCGPDGCPIVAFSDLTPAEQRVQRQRIAKQMADQGFTEQQIAKQFGVSQGTISNDLSNLLTTNKLKPAKTATNPKGAGRPKGKQPRRKPGQTQAQRSINVAPEDWNRFKDKALEEGYPSAAAKLGELIADPEIDRSVLSMSAQEKLDIAIRQHKRKLDSEFEARCREDCRRWLNEVSLPQYAKELTELERSIRSRKGIMDRVGYRKILACLHPDRVQDPVLKKRYEEAFRLFTEVEKRILDEKESPTDFRPMPRTYEDLMAMKAKVKAARQAKRAGKSTMSVR